jgi:hypothetical protein
MKEAIYKIGKYFLLLFVAAPALALLLYATIGGGSVWVIVCLMIGLAVLDIIYGPMKKIRQVIGYTFYIILGVALLYTTAGGWAVKKFNQNFPLMAETMPRTIFGLDLLGTAKKYQPMVEAKAGLLIFHQEYEKKLAPGLLKKLDEGKIDEVRAIIAGEAESWRKSKEVIMPSDEVNTKPAVLQQQQPLPQLPGRTFTFSIKPREIYTIDGINIQKGQTFTFLTYNAPIEYRVRDEESSCWEKVENNLPWRALVSGKLQIRAGNIPADVTLNIIGG